MSSVALFCALAGCSVPMGARPLELARHQMNYFEGCSLLPITDSVLKPTFRVFERKRWEGEGFSGNCGFIYRLIFSIVHLVTFFRFLIHHWPASLPVGSLIVSNSW